MTPKSKRVRTEGCLKGVTISDDNINCDPETSLRVRKSDMRTLQKFQGLFQYSTGRETTRADAFHTLMLALDTSMTMLEKQNLLSKIVDVMNGNFLLSDEYKKMMEKKPTQHDSNTSYVVSVLCPKCETTLKKPLTPGVAMKKHCSSCRKILIDYDGTKITLFGQGGVRFYTA